MKHKVIGAAAAALVAVNSMAAVAAPAVRPGMVSLPKAGAFGNTAVRAGKPMAGAKNDLLGAPLVLVALGAVAVTAGTIAITNNNNSSPN